MNTKLLTVKAALVAVLAMQAAEAGRTPVEQIAPGSFKTIIVWEENYDALQAANRKTGGRNIVKAFSTYGMLSNGGWYCEIHTLRPKEVTDEIQAVIGHELAHCMFGQYHK